MRGREANESIASILATLHTRQLQNGFTLVESQSKLSALRYGFAASPSRRRRHDISIVGLLCPKDAIVGVDRSEGQEMETVQWFAIDPQLSRSQASMTGWLVQTNSCPHLLVLDCPCSRSGLGVLCNYDCYVD